MSEEIQGQQALGLLRRIHESRALRADSQLAAEVASLLGQPGDSLFDQIEKEAKRLNENYKQLHTAIMREAERLRSLANAIGAGESSKRAMEDMRELLRMVSGL